MIRWFLLAAQLAPVGAAWGQECGRCHSREAKAAASSPMSHALQRGGESDILRHNLELRFQSGNLSYSIRRQDNQRIYSVTDGVRSISAPIEWAFGAGRVAQTYVYQRDGAYYEASVSFYPALKGLDWTPGHAERVRRNIEEAAGRKLNVEAQRCFGCHSTSAVWRGTSMLESLTPGVQCAQCHLGAAQHAAAVSRGATAQARMPKLAAMETEELANLCTKCHPTWGILRPTVPEEFPMSAISSIAWQLAVAMIPPTDGSAARHATMCTGEWRTKALLMTPSARRAIPPLMRLLELARWQRGTASPATCRRLSCRECITNLRITTSASSGSARSIRTSF